MFVFFATVHIETMPTGNLSLVIAMVAVILVLVVFLIILIIVIIIVFKCRKSRKFLLTPVYSEVNKLASLPSTSKDTVPTYSCIEEHRRSSPAVSKCEPSYHEIDMYPMPPRTNTFSQVNLKPNPMYTSSDCLDMETHEDSHFGTVTSSDSNFNIYAEPEAPPVPPYRNPTSPNFEKHYNENLSPSMFRSTNSSSSDISQLHPYSSIYAETEPIHRSEITEVKEHNINELKVLGEGQFGTVVLAHTVGISLKDLKLSNNRNADGISILVAVKKLKPDADKQTKNAFEKEIKFMARLQHENVVRLLGVCLEEQAFILMEYMENGDLHQFLENSEFTTLDTYPPSKGSLNISILIFMGLQIASGMRYLSSNNCIHRDLATRNCLVGQKFTVKIADFGMSRNLYDSNYYRLQGRAMLPIRWMSSECFYGCFSEKTDVWAYGVTMWEIFTLNKMLPYTDLSDQEVVNNAISESDHIVLEQPANCPPEVYEVMLSCWKIDPEDRTNFEEIFNSLAQIHAYSDIA